jgi:hypothetical protein
MLGFQLHALEDRPCDGRLRESSLSEEARTKIIYFCFSSRPLVLFSKVLQRSESGDGSWL